MIAASHPTSVLALPDEVADEVERRHQVLVTRLGRGARSLLDLDEPGAVDLVDDAGRTAGAVPRFGVIISAVALPRFADLGFAAHGLYRLLEPGGELWLIEPVAHVGALSRLRATWWSGSRLTRGHHLEREVPLALRATAFTITDLERFSMPTKIWPLRRFIEGRARRELPIDLATDLATDVAVGR